ncbi:MAG: hypothetical protein K8T20_01175 [Planctomycetes bacterium]|nr:hypothetical protein [Planctomycetota bacterium]
MNLISSGMALWVAAFVAAAWAAPRRWHPPVLALFGMAFLGWQDWRSLVALSGLAVAGHLLVPGPGVRGWRVAILTVAAVALLAWTRRVGMAGSLLTEGAGRNLAFLGLSYYALRVIHVGVERYQDRLRAGTFAEYLSYLAFFPALIAGPIHRCREFLHDQSRRRWDPDLCAEGFERILYGIVKIVCLGNFLVSHHANQWLNSEASVPDCVSEYLSLLFACANGYFQFAGYSDIAIGIGNITGYRLPENFDWPFLATNPRDFWQRWHASLSQWCRDHVFTPAAARFRSPYAGVVLSMTVLALWHEISPRYLVWGLWQAVGIAAWHALQSLKPRLPEVRTRAARAVLATAGCLATVNWYVLSYAILQRASFAEAGQQLLTILLFRGGSHV